MPIIGCGELSLDLLYFPAMIVVSAIKFLLLREINPNAKLHTVTMTFLSLFAETFGGLGAIYFFFSDLYRKNRAKKDLVPTKAKKKKALFKLIKSSAIKMKWSVYFYMFCLAFINVIVVFIISYIMCRYSNTKADGKSYSSILDYKLFNVEIIFISLLSYYILQISLYKHQWVSLAFILIGICLILIPNIVNEVDVHIRVPLVIATYFLASIKSVLEKYIMEVRYITSHQFTLFDGFVGSALSLLIIYVSQFIFPKDFSNLIGNHEVLFQEFKETFLNYPLYSSLVIVSMSNYALIVKLTRFYLTPMHCCISESFSVFLLWLLFMIQNKVSTVDIIVSTIGFVLLTLGNLIYNEIIVLYFCELHVNTGHEISNRSDTDLKKAVLTGIDEEVLLSGETLNYHN